MEDTDTPSLTRARPSRVDASHCSPRRPSSTMRIFSRDCVYARWLGVCRVPFFRIVVASFGDHRVLIVNNDEPKSVSYSIKAIYPTSADGEQRIAAMVKNTNSSVTGPLSAPPVAVTTAGCQPVAAGFGRDAGTTPISASVSGGRVLRRARAASM